MVQVRSDLVERVRSDVLYPDLCLKALGEVLPSEVVSFNVSTGVRLDEEGASTWQEVAALTTSALVLWFSTEAEPDSEHLPSPDATFETQTRVVPLSRVMEVNIRSAHAPDGTLQGVSTLVVLSTFDVSEVAGEHVHHFHDTLRFVKTLEAGEEDLSACLEFAQTLSRLAARPR